MMAARAQDTTERLALGELGESLGFLLRVAQLRNFERFYAAFGEVDLRPGEFSAMWMIRMNPGIRQGLVAETLRIKPAQMTKMIRRLEEMGRITRSIPDDDRRSVHLRLTPEGEAFTTRNRDTFFGQDDYQNHGLSKVECQQLAQLLRRYIDI